jgi:isopentenyl-diphosphate delta-isomerase
MASEGSENAPSGIQKRKADHLALCASGEVDFRRKGTLLDDLQLVHDALPDRHFDEIDLTTPLLGKKLRAPVVISGMTGGTPEAAQVNKDLARAAETLGLGFGVGSQRAMVIAPDLTWTYQVRDVAPNALVMGNLGIVQARQMSTSAIKELCKEVGVDALCVHLATSMELIQPGGDRDFRGGQETLKRLVGELGLPIVLKETGAGLSRRVGLTARSLGVHTVDTSGAGGTSWVGVETRRATGLAQKLGDELWDWGIPTAASVGLLSDLGIDIIATGGLRSGTDVAHALALGATAGGLAAPSLRAHKDGGYEGVIAFLESVINAVRAITFLTGCQRPSELRSAPKVIGPSLKAWLEQTR